ncbi:MAG: response regulator transcription factor [Thaumarchaeota archaeon]|nr:MAG: response regulator transcription factor [Nitrososphaerota archaeon]
MKILVVDDNSSITELLSVYFKRKGHDCTTTNSGKEGLSLCLHSKFDAIILDLAMPGFTGQDFLDSLIEEGKINEQKIIVLTALPLGDVKIEDHRHGICEVLPKPCDLSALMKKIESLNAVA